MAQPRLCSTHCYSFFASSFLISLPVTFGSSSSISLFGITSLLSYSGSRSSSSQPSYLEDLLLLSFIYSGSSVHPGPQCNVLSFLCHSGDEGFSGNPAIPPLSRRWQHTGPGASNGIWQLGWEAAEGHQKRSALLSGKISLHISQAGHRCPSLPTSCAVHCLHQQIGNPLVKSDGWHWPKTKMRGGGSG